MPHHGEGGIGRNHTASGTVEEFDAGIPFQGRHLLGYGRRGIAEPSCGPREGAEPRDLKQRPQVEKVDHQ